MEDGFVEDTIRVNLRKIVKEWELLRVLYNLILLIEGLALTSMYMDRIHPVAYVCGVIAFGLAANLCYCLGPLLEFYLAAFGIRVGRNRYVLFLAGTVFSMVVVLAGSFAPLG